ncbi:MAG: endonuclease III domain-containing protein, partial [Candidatus Woesearchaeota archaeon]
QKRYGTPQSPLHHKNAYELLIAVILSAQCTDERVNMVTPHLFKKFPTVKHLAKASVDDIRESIKSISFPNNKAINIHKTANILVNDYKGSVPDSMKDLVLLPGVGRKTANVILGDFFNKNEGFVVDTHVGRLAVRLGLTNTTNSKDAIGIEQDLMKQFPPDYWNHMSLYLIFLGREVCTAKKAYCDECPLQKLCPSAKKIKAYAKRVQVV